MKTIKLFTLLSMLSWLMLACGNEIVGGERNEEDDSSSSSSSSGNNLKTGQVEMKGYPDASGIIGFRAAAKKITIDWGDGIKDEMNPNGVQITITHDYSNRNFQEILINAENLTSISGFSNGVTHELRFGDCPNLKTINVSSNALALTVLDIKKAGALQELYCSGLTSLDVSKNTALVELYCSGLTSLDVSKNTALKGLYCSNNQLTSLDVSKNTALVWLNCTYSPLTSLDVSKNTALTTLNCDNNKLTSLNVSGANALTTLNCNRNQLTSLNVSGATALTTLNCTYNQLTDTKLDELFESLPVNRVGGVRIGGNPGTSTCSWEIAKEKGWSVNY